MRRYERYVATFNNNKKKVRNSVVSLYEWISTIVISFLIVILILSFVFRIASVSGSSMEPTLQDGNSLIVSSLKSKYEYGDIVVISQPNFLNENIIKRVIAVEGDTVDIDFEKGVVYVNGKEISEPYVNSSTNLIPPNNFDFPLTVPQGHLFVMGDNRNASLDSRSKDIGFIDERYVFGKAYFRMIPFGEWRIY